METIEQIFFRKINPSDFRNMYSVAVPSSGGGQTYIEAAGISDEALASFLKYSEMIAPSSMNESRMAFRINCYVIGGLDKYAFIEFHPRRGRNYRIIRQTENYRHPAWKAENGFPTPKKNSDGAYIDDSSFAGIIDNLLIVIIRTSYRKYYAWFVNASEMPSNWPRDVGLEAMYTGERRGILVFEDATLEFVSNFDCPFVLNKSGNGVLIAPVPMQDSYQLITYGAPGTGKSYRVDGLCDCDDVAKCFRTTFHPDSDYATFVGAYKPMMSGERIVYEFRPQAFMDAYVEAWRAMVSPENGKVKNVVLVIEEINRGNCAQIFGDLFQLLDRGNGGYSTYPINADQDLAIWLDKQFGNALEGLAKPEEIKRQEDWDEVKKGKKLALPPNLYIWATMNTSDQSLFPMDSAFKRRWDWEYVSISKPDKSKDANWNDRKIEIGNDLYDWWDFISVINKYIFKATESEDKQFGYFFVKGNDDTGYISAEQFVNKVLFYLYGDVFRSYELPKAAFKKAGGGTETYSFRDFFYNKKEGDHKPGEVRFDTIAAFLDNLKFDGIGVGKTSKTSTATQVASQDGGASAEES